MFISVHWMEEIRIRLAKPDLCSTGWIRERLESVWQTCCYIPQTPIAWPSRTKRAPAQYDYSSSSSCCQCTVLSRNLGCAKNSVVVCNARSYHFFMPCVSYSVDRPGRSTVVERDGAHTDCSDFLLPISDIEC